MSDVRTGVWPPVYDFETLESQIKRRVQTGNLFEEFYLPPSMVDTELCQGDVIQIGNEIPFIDEDGEISAFQSEGYCIVLGNSCDLSRDRDDVKFTQICPLFRLESDIPESILESLKRYEAYRRFFLPNWEFDSSFHGFYVDFTNTCSIDRCAITSAVVSARMQFLSWFVFNSCIVRYLARADKRYT